jgi:hypothetical protein
MKYYDLKKNWRHVKRHLADKELNDILDADFNKYTFGLWKIKFTSSDFPSDFETTYWYSEHRGRRPAFWTYVKAHACHWLVNFTLRLAMLVEPRREWRIITSAEHSTVWDGENTIFDFKPDLQAIGKGGRDQNATSSNTAVDVRRSLGRRRGSGSLRFDPVRGYPVQEEGRD